ncbi:MAG: HNH endonuclease, partial [Actinomycetes bacterium]|nr:HNH endonuclease [Actinomycetes bacterium]
AGIEAAVAVPVQELDRFELSEALAEVVAMESRLASMRLALLAEADARRLAEAAADSGTDAWAARLTGSTRQIMAGGLWLAQQLREKYHATRIAFAAGQINEDQVRAIVRSAAKMPAAATDEQRQQAEADLVEKAVAGLNARRLRQTGRRMMERISRELADQQEADTLEEEEERAERETWLTLHDNDDGTFSGRFVIPELQAHMLRAALERLSAPRRWRRNKSGEPVDDPTVATGLNRSESMGLSFLELLEHLPTEGHGRVGAGVVVHTSLQHLQDGLASAGLDTGLHTSAGQARRLACNAGIIPAVLGSKSEILDLGRESRLHNTAQRRALSLTYDTCAAEGCERPFAWCEIHHPHPWSEGGPTDLENALPLCG